MAQPSKSSPPIKENSTDPTHRKLINRQPNDHLQNDNLMKRSRFTLLVALPVVILGWVISQKLVLWLEIDSCLDSGGSWNSSEMKCEYE
jgi:hypothetical protein